jgi:hypothetical protein
MSTYRCPVDDCVFSSDKGIPTGAGHIDCPGPGCTEKRGGPPAAQNAAPAPAPAPAPDAFVLSDAEKAQILAARSKQS